MPTIVQSDYGPLDLEAREALGAVSSNVTILNPAIKVTDDANNPAIWLGIRGDEWLLIVDTDGKLHWKHHSNVQLDWRYDFTQEKWVDTNGEALEGEVQ